MSGLRRDLRLFDAVGVGLGAIIGAGIFVVTGVAAKVAGPSFLIGLIIAGIVAACNALSSAQLAASFPQSGGTYEYGYRVLHPWLGFAAGWMFLASKLAAGGTVAIGFGSYFSEIVPFVSPRTAAVAATIALTAGNLFGIQKAGRLNAIIVTVTVGALLYFTIAGSQSFSLVHFEPFAPYGMRGIAEAAAMLFFAYTGYARIATLGEEISEPERTIPRAIIWSLGISAVLYMAVAVVAVGAIGSDAMAATASPLQRAAESFAMPAAVWVTGLGATTAMFGVLLSQILGISRMMFAMARRRDLPHQLETVDSKHAVPSYGILLTGSVIVVLSLTGSLQTIVAAASFTILLYYGITNLAALRLSPEQRLFPQWIPVVGLVSCAALAASLPWIIIVTGFGLLAFGFVLRAAFRRD